MGLKYIPSLPAWIRSLTGDDQAARMPGLPCGGLIEPFPAWAEER